MILNLTEFILKNFRQRISWSVYQSNELLAKGYDDKDEVFSIIKETNYPVWTEEELQIRNEARSKKQREARNKRLKKLKELKEKEKKNVEIKEEIKKDDSAMPIYS